MKFTTRKEQRKVNEVVAAILLPLIPHLKEDEAEAIRLLKNEQSEIPTGSDDCISRFEVTEILNSEYDIDKILDRVDELPPVTPIRPKGHWQKIELPSRDAHECSECCGLALLDENNEQLTDFCPNCGAEMEEVEE